MAKWTTFTANTGISDPSQEFGLGSNSDNKVNFTQLLQKNLSESRNCLSESHVNLEHVAEYCENNYFQAENKRLALEETKQYTVQSLASVAYQINALAYNFSQLLDQQTVQISEMECQISQIAQNVMIHKEKIARREIGILTTNKTTKRQQTIIAPAIPEKPIKYIRKKIDFTALDDIGHGVHMNRQPISGHMSLPIRKRNRSCTLRSSNSPAAGLCSVARKSRLYHPPPVFPPPKVPDHYLPNYPFGHFKREDETNNSNLSLNDISKASIIQPTPIVAMVHPIQQSEPSSTITSMPLISASQLELPRQELNSLPLPPLSEVLKPDLPEWIPKDYLEKVIAIYDYNADKIDELNFQENAVIYVVKKNDDGWWEGVMMNGDSGLFPGNYVESCR